MYERIDKGDGTRQDLTREQLAERLSKFVSLVDEEIERIDVGHDFGHEFAWYQRKTVPGLRGTPSQQELPEPRRGDQEPCVVVYNGRFYAISEEGADALADYGPDVCAGAMSSERACYIVLRAEGLDVPEPDLLEPDVLGALVRLGNEATYLERRFFSGDFIPRREEQSDEMRILSPRIREALAAANVIIGQLRDAAVKSPRLLEQHSDRESLLFERLKVAITAWLLRNKFDAEGINFYTRTEWALRGEPYGRDSVLAMTFEGSTLYHILNGTLDDRAFSAEVEDAFRRMLLDLGFYFELGYAWSLSLYATD